MNWHKAWTTGLLGILLSACSGDGGQPKEESDGPSSRRIKASEVKNAVPKAEPRARYGNRSPYEVLGKKYTVMSSSLGYEKRGIASWYGSKFHGRRTSSGEPFDMHLATAAHRSLPLPTYAEVTNLDNGRKIIVKINDRGPFHQDRLIDLSYGAALKLGMVATGTARVNVKAISFDLDEVRRPSVKIADGTFLQVGAFGQRSSAEQLAGRMMEHKLQPVSVQQGNGLFKVWIGPYLKDSDVELAISQLIELGYDRPHRVKR